MALQGWDLCELGSISGKGRIYDSGVCEVNGN